jgi:hypothetical protein
LTPQSILEATGFTLNLEGNPPCPEPVLLTEDEAFTLPGAETQSVVDLLSLASQAGYDVQRILDVLDTAGLAFEVNLDVLDANGVVLVSALKRGALTRRDAPGTNPPSMRFRLGESLMVSDPTRTFVCASEPGEPVVLASDTDFTIEPLIGRAPDGEEDWLESFPIYDYSGGVTEGRENAYYSLYVTAGGTSKETTRPPERNFQFHTPKEPGPMTLWMIARDGHLGTSGCRLDLMVSAP